MTRDRLQQRLAALKAEYDNGQDRLHNLRLEETRIHEILLRIGGAMQVLEELLAESKPTEQADVRPIEPRSVASGSN